MSGVPMPGSKRPSSSAEPTRGALTAIDVLLEPDARMLARAAEINARLLTSIPSPQGFALDAKHHPHVTTLQRYVRSAELDEVHAAIGTVRDTVDLARLSFTAHALTHVVLRPSIGIGVIVLAPGEEVLELQRRLIDAVEPFVEAGGTADAFVRTEAEPDINDETIRFIEEYVPGHSGVNYVAHVTVGLATLDDLASFEAEPFEQLSFSAQALSVYQLGDNGVAARRLRTWPR